MTIHNVSYDEIVIVGSKIGIAHFLSRLYAQGYVYFDQSPGNIKVTLSPCRQILKVDMYLYAGLGPDLMTEDVPEDITEMMCELWWYS